MDQITTEVLSHIDLANLSIALVVGLLYGAILGFVVTHFSHLIGDRNQYKFIFPIIIPTMVLIISILKSSLALSLGLVGALSIIRFRTPIREAEELTYIFIAIAVGLGLGAGQLVPTSIAFGFIMVALIILSFMKKESDFKGVMIELSAIGTKLDSEKWRTLLKKRKLKHQVKSFDVNDKKLSLTLHLNAQSLDEVQPLLKDLRSAYKGCELSLINNV